MTKADLWRSYGLERPKKPRWANERKSILWAYTSRISRLRDWRNFGRCISCGKEIEHWTNGDAGHYIAVGTCADPEMVFNLLNVNLECNQCNAWDDSHTIGYGFGLDARYGAATALGLWETHKAHKHPIKDWGQETYHQKILEARRQWEEMQLQ